MQKWEYLTIEDHVIDPDDIMVDPNPIVHVADINAAGAGGWELVAVTGNSGHGHTYFFKRPLA